MQSNNSVSPLADMSAVELNSQLSAQLLKSDVDSDSDIDGLDDNDWDDEASNNDGLDNEALNEALNNEAQQTLGDAKLDSQGDDIKSARFRKLQKKLRKLVSWAIRDYNMIEDGDVVMVCISGGKDSFTLLDILLFLKKIAPIQFDVIAVNLDQKQPDYPEDILPNYLTEHGIPYYILKKTPIAWSSKSYQKVKLTVLRVHVCAVVRYMVLPNKSVQPKWHWVITVMISWRRFLKFISRR